MDNYHFTVSNQEMNLLMTAIQCAMLEASYQGNEDMMDAYDGMFNKLVRVVEGRA